MTTNQLPPSVTPGSGNLKDKIYLSTIPAELKRYHQWILWRCETREGKITKVPYQVNGQYADSTDAGTWSSYDDVIKAQSKGNYDGIGFVVTPTDKFCGIDLDHCRNAETGVIEPDKLQYIKLLNSYTEITPSKKGIRIWIRAKLPAGSRKRNDKLHVEIYDQGRYFTVTGKHLEGTPTTIESRQDELTQFYNSIFPPEVKPGNGGNGHRPPVDLADTELIQKAMSAKNGPSFARLWNGDTSEHDNDDSRADLALCSMLAFWTGNNESRIDTLFRQSGLYREKWERQDYRERTLKMAISGNHDTYTPPHPPCVDKTVIYYPTANGLASNRNKTVTKTVTNNPSGDVMRNISMDAVKAWVEDTNGWWGTDELDRDLGINTPELKAIRRVYISRLRQDKVIEQHQKQNKLYRRIIKNLRKIDFKASNRMTALQLRMPFQLEKLVNIYPGNIIVVAGSPDAGKTAWLLNFVRLNMAKFGIYYLSSEMGEDELANRLRKFEGLDLQDWKFEAEECSSNFADAIRPDAINIIDYMELTSDVWEVAEYQKAIHEKLGTGIAVIALQKKRGAELGRGAEFSLEKPRLYLSMDPGVTTIQKAKNWVNHEINPNRLKIKYKIVGGCKFIIEPNSGWVREDGTLALSVPNESYPYEDDENLPPEAMF